MNASSLSQYVLVVATAAAVVTGCSVNGGGTTAPAPVRGAIGNSVAHYPLPRSNALAPSDVAPFAHSKSSAYLYASSNTYANRIYVYGYDGKTGKFGRKIGTITSGVSAASGLCGDSSDVWAANTERSQLIEFKAGSTKQIASLNDPGEYPSGCSISKKRDVAASNTRSTSGGPGNVVVYKGGTGSGTAASCPNVNYYHFLAYDKHGNLWVDGFNATGAFEMCEILAGETTGHVVELSNTAPSFPGAVQWWHGYLAVGDQARPVIDLYSVKHFSGKLVKRVVISVDSGTDIVCDYIFGNYVVLNSLGGSLTSFKFPAAGAPVDTLQGVGALGVVIVQ